MGPPDHISVYQGTAYVSKEMRENMAASSIHLEEAPIENPGSICVVEIYYEPFRSAYNRSKCEIGHTTSPEDCLVLAVHADN